MVPHAHSEVGHLQVTGAVQSASLASTVPDASGAASGGGNEATGSASSDSFFRAGIGSSSPFEWGRDRILPPCCGSGNETGRAPGGARPLARRYAGVRQLAFTVKSQE